MDDPETPADRAKRKSRRVLVGSSLSPRAAVVGDACATPPNDTPVALLGRRQMDVDGQGEGIRIELLGGFRVVVDGGPADEGA